MTPFKSASSSRHERAAGNETKVLQQEAFPLTILKVLRRPPVDVLEVRRHVEEITDAEDLRAHAATTAFEVLDTPHIL